MNNVLITIDGSPIAKQRHRTSKGRTYNPQSEIEAAVVWEIKSQLMPGFLPLKGPLILGIDAHFPRPKSHFGTGRNAGNLKKFAPMFHTRKPDHDNVIKFYMDCMTGVVFEDDVQVVGFMECGKVWAPYGSPGKVQIHLESA